MNAPRPPLTLSRLAVVTAIFAGLISVASLQVLRFLYRDCVEMACMGVLFFVPVAAVGSGLAALVAGARAGQGCRGYAAALAGATVGFLVVMLLIRELRLLGG